MMKFKLINSTNFILVVAILVSTLFLSSCSNGESKIDSFDISEIPEDEIYSEPGNFPFVSDKLNVTLKIAVDNSVLVTDYENNEFTKYIEENANINIEWLVWDSTTSRKLFEESMKSGEYPDIFLGIPILNSDIEKYGVKEKKFIPINDLIENETAILNKIMDSNDQIYNIISSSDGNIYSVPSIDEDYPAIYGSKFWINKDWLDNLGLKVPETTKEFYNTLIAFRDLDPNQNNKNDEIPLLFAKARHSSLNFLLNSFLQTNYEFADYSILSLDDNSRVVADIIKPEYKEALSYLNLLYKEGLIYKKSFEIGASEVRTLFKTTPDLIGCFASENPMDILGDYEYLNSFIPLAPLEGPDGHKSTAVFPDYPTIGSFVITDKCKYPIVAIKLADYLLSPEGTLNNLFGIFNKGWKDAREHDEGIYENVVALWKRNESLVNEKNNLRWLRGPYWFDAELKIKESYSKIKNNIPKDKIDLEKYLYNVTHDYYELFGATYIKNVIPPLNFTQEESKQIQEIWSELGQYIAESSKYLVVASSNIDEDWDEYLNKLKDLNIEQYISLHQIAYDRQYK